MRLLKTCSEGFVFQVSRREKELLLTIVRLYPQLPEGHHKLSRSGDTDPSNQALLEEALAEQRSENQRKLHKLLSEPARWAQSDRGWRLTLAEGDIEWLLQVLNDIRVGSWVLLGSPEENISGLSDETVPHLWAMEVSGAFQISLLKALEGG